MTLESTHVWSRPGRQSLAATAAEDAFRLPNHQRQRQPGSRVRLFLFHSPLTLYFSARSLPPRVRRGVEPVYAITH